MPTEGQIKDAIESSFTESEAEYKVNELYRKEQEERDRQNYKAYEYAKSQETSVSSGDGSHAVEFVLHSIFSILKNIPALLPAWLIMVFLWHEVYRHFMDGLMLLAANLVTLVALTFIMWQVFRFILVSIGTLSKPLRLLGYGIFWCYILGCYGGFAYHISVESEFSQGTTIVCVVVACLLGAVGASKQMQLVDEKED